MRLRIRRGVHFTLGAAALLGNVFVACVGEQPHKRQHEVTLRAVHDAAPWRPIAGQSARDAAELPTFRSLRGEKIVGPGLRSGDKVAFVNDEETPSRLTLSVEALFAFLWVCMVTSMPLLAMSAVGGRVTKAHKVVSIVTWVIFLGYFFLFTHVLTFKSRHFEEARSLTLVECVYVMAQILATVGYGDIVPATSVSRAAVAFYVVFTILVLADLVSQVTRMAAENSRRYADQLREAALVRQEEIAHMVAEATRNAEEASDSDYDEDATPPNSARESPREQIVRIAGHAAINFHLIAQKSQGQLEEFMTTYGKQHPVPLLWANFVVSLLVFVLFCFVGSAFFHYCPGEGKSWSQAIYMSIITLTTVGFGSDTPTTDAGKVFCAFWMVFGAGSLVAVVEQFVELVAQMKARERESEATTEKVDDLFDAMPETCDYNTFVRFELLKNKAVEADELDRIDKMFASLSTSGDTSGTVHKTAIDNMLSLEEHCDETLHENDGLASNALGPPTRRQQKRYASLPLGRAYRVQGKEISPRGSQGIATVPISPRPAPGKMNTVR